MGTEELTRSPDVWAVIEPRRGVIKGYTPQMLFCRKCFLVRHLCQFENNMTCYITITANGGFLEW